MKGSVNAFVSFDMSYPFPRDCRIVPETKKKNMSNNNKRKIRDNNSTTSSRCTACIRYGNMSHMEYINDDELIIVEQQHHSNNDDDIMSRLPDPLQRKIFAT